MAKRKAKVSREAGMAKAGIKDPGVVTGPVDDIKSKIANRIKKTAGVAMFNPQRSSSRTAGMMMDNLPIMGESFYGASSLGAYKTSYASGMQSVGGMRDIPNYFVLMNEQNGGILYWPVTLREKYEWYRYFTRTDAYIGRAMDLLVDLPMSKIRLNMPNIKGQTQKQKEEIFNFYNAFIEDIDLFETLQQILMEYNMIGNCHAFHEWDDKEKKWTKIVILPPEEVSVFQYPFSDKKRVEYRPEKLIKLVQASQESGGVQDSFYKEIADNIPKEIKDMVKKNGAIIMDTDPSTGSFVHHFARRKSPYMDLGISILERVLVPMLQKEHFRYTQLSLASRNMTPKNKISAPNLLPDELDELRSQIDLSYLDPDYSVVTNYEWDWEQLGADGRLLDLDREYERIENQVFAAMGVTRSLLTGEGAYSGERITIEVLNTIFLLTREMLKKYVEKRLFVPMAEARGWYEDDANGVRKYHSPTIGFNRLTIRDNRDVFDSLFQLYQKGSLPVDVIYEIFNLEPDSLHDEIKEDLFTVKDPTFNRTIEEVSSEAGRAIVEKTDIVEKIAKYLGVKMKESSGEEEDGFGSFASAGFGDGFEAEKEAKRGLQVKRKDVDLMKDTGGTSKGRTKEPDAKPSRDEMRNTQRKKNKSPIDRDKDTDNDPDLEKSNKE